MSEIKFIKIHFIWFGNYKFRLYKSFRKDQILFDSVITNSNFANYLEKIELYMKILPLSQKLLLNPFFPFQFFFSKEDKKKIRLTTVGTRFEGRYQSEDTDRWDPCVNLQTNQKHTAPNQHTACGICSLLSNTEFISLEFAKALLWALM